MSLQVLRSVCLWLALAALSFVAACGGGARGSLTSEQLSAVAFRSEEPSSITIITMINNRSGAGGHTALMVSASQRVIFDPAGSYRPDYITNNADVLYGVSDVQLRRYKSAHARATHHVVSQKILVSPAVAEQALALVQARGKVPGAFCTNSSSAILRQLPGFEDVKVTFFPARLMDDLSKRSDVETDKYYENDAGDVLDGIPAQL